MPRWTERRPAREAAWAPLRDRRGLDLGSRGARGREGERGGGERAGDRHGGLPCGYLQRGAHPRPGLPHRGGGRGAVCGAVCGACRGSGAFGAGAGAAGCGRGPRGGGGRHARILGHVRGGEELAAAEGHLAHLRVGARLVLVDLLLRGERPLVVDGQLVGLVERLLQRLGGLVLQRERQVLQLAAVHGHLLLVQPLGIRRLEDVAREVRVREPDAGERRDSPLARRRWRAPPRTPSPRCWISRCLATRSRLMVDTR